MKYKEAGRKSANTSLFSTLSETLETQHAREASQLQSQVTGRLPPHGSQMCTFIYSVHVINNVTTAPSTAEVQTEFTERRVQFVPSDARNHWDAVCQRADGDAEPGDNAAQQILHIVFTSRRQTNDEGFLTCLFIITRSNTKKMEEKRWVWIFFLQLCLRLWRHWGSKSSRSCRATYVFISALHVWLVCDCVSGRSETTWTSLMFSLSFRVNTKRTVRRRRPNLCTVNFLKHWRRSTQKRRRSCKVR